MTYHFRQALLAMRGNLTATLATLGTMTLTLLMLGFVVLLTQNVGRDPVAAGVAGGGAAFLRDGADTQGLLAITDCP